MKLVIMQPYLFPYLGYWQMVANADTFVIYDDVNYIKNGWINRNNLLSNGEAHLFTLALDKASPFKKINETFIKSDADNRNKVLSFIRNAYLKAPYFKTVFPLIEEIITYPENNLAQYLENHFRKMFEFLEIKTKILVSSKLEKNCELHAQDKVLDICTRLGAAEYVNAIGGQELYSKDDFAEQGIRLNFIKMRPVSYPQFKNEFVPNLSIIDVLMFNDKETVRKMLNEYDLV